MALPSEVLGQIKTSIEEAEAKVKEMEKIVSDLRVSGIDASIQEQGLREVKEQLRQLRVFYGRQVGS